MVLVLALVYSTAGARDYGPLLWEKNGKPRLVRGCCEAKEILSRTLRSEPSRTGVRNVNRGLLPPGVLGRLTWIFVVLEPKQFNLGGLGGRRTV